MLVQETGVGEGKEGGGGGLRQNYCSIFIEFPICLTWVLVNGLGLRLPRQSGASRTQLAYFL